MKRFGLIGKTLKHSFSKKYFSEKFAREGIQDCSYENYELQSIHEIAAVLDDPNLCGLNITIPYKTDILPYLHSKDELVNKIGACNCIRISNGKLHGFNTDAMAFRTSLLLHLKNEGEGALVLGTGGASKAVQFILADLAIPFKLISREKGTDRISYDDLDEEMVSWHKIIINTTPVGMYPHIDEAPKLPYPAISSEHLLYDLTYNPPKTKFLRYGEEKGATIVNGYEMLVGQAEESWRIWQGLH